MTGGPQDFGDNVLKISALVFVDLVIFEGRQNPRRKDIERPQTGVLVICTEPPGERQDFFIVQDAIGNYPSKQPERLIRASATTTTGIVSESFD